MVSTSTYGSQGIARYRIVMLKRAGVPNDAPELRAARARLACLREEPCPEGDEAAIAAYADEVSLELGRRVFKALLDPTKQPWDDNNRPMFPPVPVAASLSEADS